MSNSRKEIRMISLETIILTTRSKSDDKPAKKKDGNPSFEKAPFTSSSSSLSNGPLMIEKPNLDLILCPPKSTLGNSVFNSNARVA